VGADTGLAARGSSGTCVRKERSVARAYRLAVFTKNRTNPAYVGARLGAERMAERLACSVTHYVPDRPDDVDEQRRLLTRALNEGADAIVLAPTHATALNGVLSNLQTRGIPLVCFVSRPQGIDPLCFLGANDCELARRIAHYLFDHVRADAQVVSIDGHGDAMTTAPRAAGFRAAAAARPGVRIIAASNGAFQREGGEAAMLILLRAQQRIDGVLAANDAMALGAIEAMHQNRRLSPIVGVNATPDAIKAIRSGRLLASAAFDAMKLAALAVEAAVRVLRAEAVPSQLLLPVEIVHRANCEAWDRAYEARPLPEWHRAVEP
jgi:ribose transport system substrate-binding protein